jgi:hypothetical protein
LIALEGVETARRFGLQEAEEVLLENVASISWLLGDWEMMADAAAQVTSEAPYAVMTRAVVKTKLSVVRGELERARLTFDTFGDHHDDADHQFRGAYCETESFLLCGEGRYREAAASARAAREAFGQLGDRLDHPWLSELEAVAALGDVEALEETLALADPLAPAERTPFIQAIHARFLGRLQHQRGAADSGFGEQTRAANLFRALELSYLLALTQLEHAEALAAGGDTQKAELLLREARETFGRLDARVMLERADAIAFAAPVA